jgi:hypothetical protein
VELKKRDDKYERLRQRLETIDDKKVRVDFKLIRKIDMVERIVIDESS